MVLQDVLRASEGDIPPRCEGYYVYIDIKDTHSSENACRLEDVCAANAHDFSHEDSERVQPIRSDEVQIMQLVDIPDSEPSATAQQPLYHPSDELDEGRIGEWDHHSLADKSHEHHALSSGQAEPAGVHDWR